MKPYQPSNKVPSAGFKWLILSSILGGLAIGGITFALSRIIYLLILFPLGMGVVGGTVMANAIRQGKVRNPLIGVTFGVLTGLITYSTIHVGEYLLFKHRISQQIQPKLSQFPGIETEQFIDAYLQQETGNTGFIGYLKYAAKQGVSIGRVGQEGILLNETFTWLYWLVEFTLIEGMIVASAYANSREPFCEGCEQWYDHPKRIGNVRHLSSKQVLNFISQSNFVKAGRLIDPLGITYVPSLEVQLQSCSHCQANDSVLTLYRTSLGDQGKIDLKQVLQGKISPSETLKLLQPLPGNLYQNPKQKSDNSETEQLYFGQVERSFVKASDCFEPHGLSEAKVAKLVEQLSRYRQLKEIYLVRKVVQYFSEKPLYVLGINRRSAWLESEIAEKKLVNRLATELDLPNQTLIVTLNKQKSLQEAFKQIPSAAIYHC